MIMAYIFLLNLQKKYIKFVIVVYQSNQCIHVFEMWRSVRVFANLLF